MNFEIFDFLVRKIKAHKFEIMNCLEIYAILALV